MVARNRYFRNNTPPTSQVCATSSRRSLKLSHLQLRLRRPLAQTSQVRGPHLLYPEPVPGEECQLAWSSRR
eukprot:5040390-Prymnesium_polylepis.1